MPRFDSHRNDDTRNGNNSKDLAVNSENVKGRKSSLKSTVDKALSAAKISFAYPAPFDHHIDEFALQPCRVPHSNFQNRCPQYGARNGAQLRTLPKARFYVLSKFAVEPMIERMENFKLRKIRNSKLKAYPSKCAHYT